MTSSVSFVCALKTPGNFFVAGLYDPATVPATLLETQYVAPGGGYPVPPASFQVTFLTPLTLGKQYQVILWESPNTSVGGLARISDTFNASLNQATLRGDLRLVGGSSSGLPAGGTTYTDPTSSLAGWNYSLELFGTGTLGLGVDYTIDPTTGNWTLVNGTTVQAGQIYIIHFQPQISMAPALAPAVVSSGQIITTSRTLDTSYKNQALFIQSATTSITIALPALSTYANYTDRLYLYSNGGSHQNVIFLTQGSDQIFYRTPLSQIILGQGERMVLFRANGYWNVDESALPGVDNVGQIIDSMMVLPNTIQLKGQLLDRSQYARLYAWANAVGAFVSESAWGTANGAGYFTNKAFFTQGVTGASNFRLPDLTVYGTTRAVDGTVRTPGSFQQELIKAHKHATDGTGQITGSGGPYFLHTAGGTDHSYSGGGGDGFGRNGSIDSTQRTSDGSDDPTFPTGTENRLNNSGVLRLIRI